MQVLLDFYLDASQYKSKRGYKEARANVLKKTQDAINVKPDCTLSTERRYFVRIPLISAHAGHPVGHHASVGHSVDKRIVSKIYDLVKNNVTKTADVKSALERYVEEDLFRGFPRQKKPQKSSRKYYPRRRDLRNHIAKAIKAFRYSSDDQESLKRKIADWEAESPESKFRYRTRDDTNSTEGCKEQSFLFVHQEAWQQRLLMRYGKELIFMDATYKTTRYAIPLFFSLRPNERWIQSGR